MTDYASRVSLQREVDSLFPDGALVTLLERSESGALFPISEQVLCPRPFVVDSRTVEGQAEFRLVFDSLGPDDEIPIEVEPALGVWTGALEDADLAVDDGLMEAVESRFERPSDDPDRVVRLAVPTTEKKASAAHREALTAFWMVVAFPAGLEVADG